MPFSLLRNLTFGLTLALADAPAWAQAPAGAAPPDSVAVVADRPARRAWYEGNLVKAVAVPAVLIGYGLTVRADHGLYSSVDARNDIRHLFGDLRSRVDDGLVLVPYAELGLLALLKIPGRHDRINTGLLIVKSSALAVTTFTTVKYLARERRPDGSDRLSFPSGHTAMAFCAASLVHQEFRAHSPWPGVGAYVVASSVGVFRMINDRHWQSDVLVGAGIGILSVHATYLTHRYRWGRRPAEGPGAVPPRAKAQLSPWALPGRGAGVGLVVRF